MADFLKLFKIFALVATAWKVSKYEIFSGPYFPVSLYPKAREKKS